MKTRARLVVALALVAVTSQLLLLPAEGQIRFANTEPITIPIAVQDAPWPGAPYPSNVAVSGLVGAITDVNLTLHGFDCSPGAGLDFRYPEDIDMLLVGPTGANVVVLSDVGGANDESTITARQFSNIGITLDDEAVDSLPVNTQLSSGTYRPTNDNGDPGEQVPVDTFPAPAPAPSEATALSIFDGTNPNGTWSLYVVDDYRGPSNCSVRSGWSLDISTNAEETTTTTAPTTSTTTAPTTTTTTAPPPELPSPFRVVRQESPDPQALGRFGDRLATAGDLNGDGANDLWVGVYRHNLPGAENAGRVYAISGRTRQVLYSIDSPEPQHEPPTRPLWAGFGWSVTNLGDVNGDGVDDLGAGSVRHDVYTGSGAPCGTPEPNGCNENQGRAWVFSGATGRLLYVLDNPEPQGTAANPAHFGWVGTAGDVNGDGISEVLVGAEANDSPRACADAASPAPGCRRDEGQAFIFDGRTGALLRTLATPTEDRYVGEDGTCQKDCGQLGIVAQGPGDVNGDGVPDQLVSAWGYDPIDPQGWRPTGSWQNPTAQGRMYLYSGKDGSLLRRIDSPEVQPTAGFGLQIVEPLAPGDVNGDGVADVYGNGFLHTVGSNPAQGRSWVFDGKTGAVLYALNDPTPELGGQFGYSLARTDYNGDGVADLYIGSSPHHGAGAATNQSGGSYIFDGRDGSLLAALELPASDVQTGTGDPGAGNIGPNLGRSVIAPGDLDGDKKLDYVAGAPNMDVGENRDQGVLYYFFGTQQNTRPDENAPTSKEQCKNEGWRDLGYRNQGQCVSAIVSQRRAEERSERSGGGAREGRRR